MTKGGSLQESWQLKRLKAVLTGAVLLALGLSVARATLLVANNFSVGMIMRATILPLSLLGLLSVLCMSSFQNFRLSFPRPVIRVNQIVVIFLTAPLFAYFALSISHVNLTWVIIILAALGSCAFSLFLAATRDDIYPLVAFLLTLPFLAFLEWDLTNWWPSVGMLVTKTGISMSAIFLWLFTGVFAVRRFGLSKQRIIRTPLDKYVLAFVGALFLSSILSPNPAVSFKVFLQVCVTMPLFFFLTTNCVRSKRDLHILLWTMMGYGVLRTSSSHYFSLQHTGYDLVQLFEGSTGLAGSIAGIQEVIGIVLIPLSLSLVLVSSNMVKRIAIGLAIIFVLAVPIMNQTRGFVVVLLITYPLFLLYKKSKIQVFFSTVLLFLVGAICFDFLYIFRRLAAWTSIDAFLQDFSVIMRLDGWWSAWRMMMDHPISGNGLGMWSGFIHLYGKLFTWKMAGGGLQSAYIPYCHNFFLHYGAGGGIGAMLTLALLILAAIIRCVSLLKTFKNDVDSHTLVVGLFWAITALTLKGTMGGLAFEYDWYLDMGIVFWTLIGVIASFERICMSHN